MWGIPRHEPRGDLTVRGLRLHTLVSSSESLARCASVRLVVESLCNPFVVSPQSC
jgi:hypothetical protein